jgi:multiple sugar transport system permease protein
MQATTTRRPDLTVAGARPRLGRGADPYLLLVPALAVLFLVSVYPTIYAFYLSLTTHVGGVNEFVGLANYAQMVRDPLFWDSLRVTATFVVGVIAIELALGLGLALLLNQGLPGEWFFRTLLVLPMAATPIVVALAWRIMLNSTFGIVNYVLGLFGIPPQGWLGSAQLALPTLMLIDAWQWTPFVALILLAGLQSLPRGPLEAARIDGATEFQVFRHVTVPLLGRVIAIAAVFRFVDAVKTFDIIYGTTGGGPGTTTQTTNIFSFLTGFRWGQLGYAAAIAITLTFVVSLIAARLLSSSSD